MQFKSQCSAVNFVHRCRRRFLYSRNNFFEINISLTCGGIQDDDEIRGDEDNQLRHRA